MIKRNIVANYAGTAWNAAMSLAFVPAYIRYLGPDSYGLVGASAMINAYLSILDLGLSPMLGREASRMQGGAIAPGALRSLLRIVEITYGTLGAIGVFLLWTLAPWLAGGWFRSDVLEPEVISHALRIMSLMMGLRFLESLYRSALSGLQLQVSLNVVSSASATLRGVGSLLVLGWWDPSISTFFWWQAVVAGASTVTFAILAYRSIPHAHASVSTGMSELRRAWPFARGMLVGAGMGLMVTQTDKLLLTRLLDLADYGKYSLAVTAASTLPMLTIPIQTAYYPRFTQALSAADLPRAKADFRRSIDLVVVIAGSAGVFLAVFPDHLIRIWTGDAALSGAIAAPLSMLAVSGIGNSLVAMPYAAQLAAGRTSTSNWLGGAACAVIVPMLLAVVPRHGLSGATFVVMCTQLALLCAFVPIALRQLPIQFRPADFLRTVAPPLLASTLTCGALRTAVQHVPKSSPLAGMALAGCFAGSFLAAVLCSREIRQSVWSRMSQMIERKR